MGLFDLFENKREKCKTDDCINKTFNFIKVICSFNAKDLDCPILRVDFGVDSITCYFFDSDNSSPCIYMNMIHRNQADEDAVNQLIGKAICADELPKGTKIEWHFDEGNNEYDYYVLRYNIVTEHNKCGLIYLDYVKNMCVSYRLNFETKGNSLHFKLK